MRGKRDSLKDSTKKKKKKQDSGVYLIGTGNNAGKFVIALLLTAFGHGFEDGGMVGSEIDKDMADSGLPSQNTVYGIAKELSLYLPKGLEEGKRCSVDPGRAVVSGCMHLITSLALHD